MEKLFFKSSVNSQKGQAMLETALTFPLFFLLTLAGVQFSATTYRLQAIYYAADKGARMAVLAGDAEAQKEVKSILVKLGVSVEDKDIKIIHPANPDDPVQIELTTANPSILGLVSTKFETLTSSGAAYPSVQIQRGP